MDPEVRSNSPGEERAMKDQDSPPDGFERRDFLRLGSAGLVGSRLTLDSGRGVAAEPARDRAAAAKVGRPVRVVSLSFRDRPMAEIVDSVDREGARGADLIALPETWRGQNSDTQEPLDGPTVTRDGCPGPKARHLHRLPDRSQGRPAPSEHGRPSRPPGEGCPDL